jgi:hypothetical protein
MRALAITVLVTSILGAAGVAVVSAQEPSPEAVGIGGRVEVAEAGLAVTLPDGWLWATTSSSDIAGLSALVEAADPERGPSLSAVLTTLAAYDSVPDLYALAPVGPDLTCGFENARMYMVTSSLVSQAGSDFGQPRPKSHRKFSPKVTVPSACAAAMPGSIAAIRVPAARLVMKRFFTKLSPIPRTVTRLCSGARCSEGPAAKAALSLHCLSTQSFPRYVTTSRRYPRPMSDEPENAWAAVHAATPDGWYVGRPSEHPERREWVMFAFDTRERAIEGKRSGE